jgi:hypothetical protein
MVARMSTGQTKRRALLVRDRAGEDKFAAEGRGEQLSFPTAAAPWS